MKARRIISLLLTLMLAFGLVLAFTACNPNEPTDPTECTQHKDDNGDGICDTEGCGASVTTEDLGDYVNENGELILFKDGVPTFKFVYGENSGLAAATTAELIRTLNNYSKEEIKGEYENDNIQAVEILIGNVSSRGAQYVFDEHDYGMTGYMVKQIGTKIVLIGGSEDALISAVNYLKSDVFGIKKSNKDFTDLVMAADKNHDKKQTGYAVSEVIVGGKSLKELTLTYPQGDTTARELAYELQEKLYVDCGIWCETAYEHKATGNKFAIRSIENDGEGGGFYVNVTNGDFIIECEYDSEWFGELVTDFMQDNVFSKRNTATLAEGFSYEPNLRDIYYKDFGAISNDGKDDFFAIKAAHDKANVNLLNVHAEAGAIYYIGSQNGAETITVQTNTYWHGCQFIFDDSNVAYDSDGRSVNIFTIKSDSSSKSYNQSNSPIKSLTKGQEKIDNIWGVPVMLVVYNNNVRHYIREGANAAQTDDRMKQGSGQHELLLIDAEGNVDPNTPVQWDYSEITSMTVYYVNDRPIEVRGEGEDGERTLVTTWYNQGPNTYWYYYRSIGIRRSNVILSGIEHVYDKYTETKDGGHGCPYNGFTAVNNCNNVTIDNMIFFCPPDFDDIETDTSKRPSGMQSVTNGGMGSYEMSASLANNVTWSNCSESNFFNEDGTVTYHGLMGTNFCKNLTFDNMFVCSFDAHQGVYNATMKNSTLEHVNFIGDGTIKYENVTVYTDGNRHAVNLRSDYGSTWAGKIEIDGLIMKALDKSNLQDLALVKLDYINWRFYEDPNDYTLPGTTYMPQFITLKNVLVQEYSYTLVGSGNGTSNRVESDTYTYNALPLRVFTNRTGGNVTGYKYYNMNDNCNIKFDTATEIDGKTNINYKIPPQEIWLWTEYTDEFLEKFGIERSQITKDLDFRWPSGTYYLNTKYYLNGEIKGH